MAARAAGSVGDEARALIIVSILELRSATWRRPGRRDRTGRPRLPASGR